MSESLSQRMRRWLDRRIPPQRKITLNQKRIFIFPSRAGWLFLAVLGVMLLAAINYQNNMVFALTFLLGSLLLIAVLHTYGNLSGLTLQAVRGYPTFAGQRAEFELRVSREGRRHYHDIALYWPGQDPTLLSLTDNNDLSLRLHLPAQRRGWLRPGRLKVETVYPLGLLRAWTWLDLDIEALVYPRPVQMPRQPITASAAGEEGEAGSAVGSEDFDGFRAYRPGDPLRHAYWKAYARGQPLHTKQYAALKEQRHWLSWEDFSGDTERRLSGLCHWVLQYTAAGDVFGLRLPGQDLAPASGDQQREAALRMLALYRGGAA